jgi:hypothetical protein
MSNINDINKLVEEIQDTNDLCVLYFGVKKMRETKWENFNKSRSDYNESDNQLQILMNKIDNLIKEKQKV